MTPLKVGILATHPVQYQVPWFQALARRPELDLTVYYAHLPTPQQQGAGFGLPFTWDLPLLEGYRHERLRNVSPAPALQTFRGCDTPEIGAVLARQGFDAFIVNGWHVKSCLQALGACLRRRVPCLVRGDSNALKPRPLAVRLAHRLLLARYAAFLSVGRANAEFYRRNGVSAHKLFHAPHCVDNERFAAQAEALRPARAALRAGFGLEEDAFVFLFCGKLIPKKRPLDLISACARAAAASPGRAPRLLVVGDGELRPACERLAAERGAAVTFAGFLNQTEIARAYVAADALVLPSDYGETWGLVVNEAMACGLPALVSDRVGCHPDLVEPGRTGEVFPFGDVPALAERLSHWAAQPGMAAERGARARRHVAAYSLTRLVDATLAALLYAASAAGRRARERGGPAAGASRC